MNKKVKIGTTLAGVIIGAISYWFQPYNQLQITESFIPIVWATGAFLSALVFTLFQDEKPSKIALFVSLGVVLAVLFRIIYDISFWDKTSHNLAPFEIIICGIITIPSAIAGAYLANLLRKIKK